MNANRFQVRTYFFTMVLAATVSGMRAQAQTSCGGSTGPDVIVGRLNSVVSWGSIGDIAAFSVGTTSCNMGDTVLLWDAPLPTHPVIGQNMYRLKDGRFEQIGMSWLKHGFLALTQNECCACQNPGDGARLGIGCSDPYSASLNGSQSVLGPRFEVNATTGVFPYPFSSPQGATGNAIFKRLQVHHTDLEPTLNDGATYFVDGHYVTPDDAAAGNHYNNVSYQPVNVSGGGTSFSIFLTGATQKEKPAIQAWQNNDPSVTMETVDDADGGRFVLAYKASDNGDGTTHYEYALYNMNSHLSAQQFSVPIPVGVMVTNIGFHDVDYYSGEPYPGTDWSVSMTGGALTWSSVSFAENQNANALRWGSLYNFRFDADMPEQTVDAAIGLFRPTANDTLFVPVAGPSDLPTITVAQGETVVIVPGRPTCDPAVNCAPLDDEMLMVTNTCETTGTISADVLEEDLHPGALRFRSAGRTFVIDTDLDPGCLETTIVMPFSQADLGNFTAGDIALTWFDDRAWLFAVCGNTTPAPLCPFPNQTFLLETDPDPEPTLADLHARNLGTHGVYWNGTRGFSWARVDHASDFAVALSRGPIPAVSHWGALALALAVLATGTIVLRSRRRIA